MMENSMMKKMGRGMAQAKMAEKGMPAKKAAAKKPAMKMAGASKMGNVKTNSRPDGVITHGGTKGKVVKMAGGGKTC
jgi:hypothetical protein